MLPLHAFYYFRAAGMSSKQANSTKTTARTKRPQMICHGDDALALTAKFYSWNDAGKGQTKYATNTGPHPAKIDPTISDRQHRYFFWQQPAKDI
eukprot:scaffold20597_cov167-Amphora_coffeaeformis.AAC.2